MLGAPAPGEDGVDKRVNALAALIQMRAMVYDFEEAQLCYAPPFGSAKDPVNFGGMFAADVLRGDMPISQWIAARRRSFWMSGNRSSSRWKACRKRSTSRLDNFGRASASCLASARSTSSAVPAACVHRDADPPSAAIRMAGL